MLKSKQTDMSKTEKKTRTWLQVKSGTIDDLYIF